MKIKTDENQEEELKGIWQKIFLDDRKFIDLFFSYYYKSEYVFKTIKDEKIISCLYLLPFEMNFLGENVKTAYLCGAATLEEYRGMGEMGKLIHQSLQDLYENNVEFCTLIPFTEKLFQYYDGFGFFSAYNAKTFRYKKKNIPCDSINLVETTDIEYIEGFYNEYLYNKELSLKRDEGFFQFLIKDNALIREAAILKILKDKKECGYVIFISGEVKEFVFIENDDEMLFEAVLQYFKKEEMNIICPMFYENCVGEPIKTGMIRIINLYNVLSHWASKNINEKMLFSVTDKNIPQNNGTYKIDNGKVSKVNQKAKVSLHINDVERILLKDTGYINLLLN